MPAFLLLDRVSLVPVADSLALQLGHVFVLEDSVGFQFSGPVPACAGRYVAVCVFRGLTLQFSLKSLCSYC
jgi:hypothetical protein